eukprot:2632519-Rhodomonas_salina.3
MVSKLTLGVMSIILTEAPPRRVRPRRAEEAVRPATWREARGAAGANAEAEAARTRRVQARSMGGYGSGLVQRKILDFTSGIPPFAPCKQRILEKLREID